MGTHLLLSTVFDRKYCCDNESRIHILTNNKCHSSYLILKTKSKYFSHCGLIALLIFSFNITLAINTINNIFFQFKIIILITI